MAEEVALGGQAGRRLDHRLRRFGQGAADRVGEAAAGGTLGGVPPDAGGLLEAEPRTQRETFDRRHVRSLRSQATASIWAVATNWSTGCTCVIW